MNWKEIWMTLFGTTQWLGLNIGFWVAMAAVLLIVILMNVIFWGIKPRQYNSGISSVGEIVTRPSTAICFIRRIRRPL